MIMKKMERIKDRSLITPFLNDKRRLEKYLLFQSIFFLLFYFVLPLNASGPVENSGFVYGYKDDDKDGVNDLYFDKNGDGVSDLNADKLIDIIFEDEDDDGINDIFTDEDGDGINDKIVFSNYLPVIDRDLNFVNDITGHKYKKGFYDGLSYGKVIEEMGIIIEEFRDINKDNMDDRVERSIREFKNDERFSDEDGDGINDERESKNIVDIKYRKINVKPYSERGKR